LFLAFFSVLTEFELQKLTHTRECIVVERLSPQELYAAGQPVFRKKEDAKLLFGGDGRLGFLCQLNKTIYKAGEVAYLAIGIDNKTTRKITGIKMLLMRRAVTAVPARPRTVAQKVVLERVLEGDDYTFGKIETREVLTDLLVPTGLVRVYKALVMEISYFLRVELIVPFSKNPMMELPFEICHPASLEMPARFRVFDYVTNQSLPEPRFEEEQGEAEIVVSAQSTDGVSCFALDHQLPPLPNFSCSQPPFDDAESYPVESSDLFPSVEGLDPAITCPPSYFNWVEGGDIRE